MAFTLSTIGRVRFRRVHNMWEALRELWLRLGRRFQESAEESRVDRDRARFWAEVREGEREAESSEAESRLGR